MQAPRETSPGVRIPTPFYPHGMLAEWTKRNRKARKWTQEQLAERAGLDRVEINAIERGRNKGTTSRIREGLARAFGISPSMVGKEPGATIEYEPGANPTLAQTAIANHRDWQRARMEVLDRFARTTDEAVLDRVGELALSRWPEHLTAEFVKGLHDALAMGGVLGGSQEE